MKNTGGSAFPTLSEWDEGKMRYTEEGMTLRDYFAAKAMQSLVAMSFNSSEIQIDAESAYMMADAMLAERDK